MKSLIYTILFSLTCGIAFGQNAPENIDVGVFEPGTYNGAPPANATLEVAINPDMVFPMTPAAAELNFILQVPTGLVNGGEVYAVTADNLPGGDMIAVPAGEGGVFEYAGVTYIFFVYNGSGITLNTFGSGNWVHAFTIHISNLQPGTEPSDFAIADASTQLFMDFGSFYRTAINVLGFNEFYPISTMGALPLQLVDFDAKPIDNRSTKLSWVTANEFNTDYFTIERSFDQSRWTPVGNVEAKGFHVGFNLYNFVDENVYNGRDEELKVYYRLQMVDRDDYYDYSPIESVTFRTSGFIEGTSFNVYPNPATEGINIEWNAGGTYQPTSIEVYDITGKLIHTQAVGEFSTQEYIDFKRAKVSQGLYQVRILAGTEPIEYKQIVVGQN